MTAKINCSNWAISKASFFNLPTNLWRSTLCSPQQWNGVCRHLCSVEHSDLYRSEVVRPCWQYYRRLFWFSTNWLLFSTNWLLFHSVNVLMFCVGLFQDCAIHLSFVLVWLFFYAMQVLQNISSAYTCDYTSKIVKSSQDMLIWLSVASSIVSYFSTDCRLWMILATNKLAAGLTAVFKRPEGNHPCLFAECFPSFPGKWNGS